jgi:hypothetical protein
MKASTYSQKTAAFTCGALSLAGLALAGTPSMISEKSGPAITTAEAPYEAGRGLLTLQGPTGMFINPTSATLPQGAFTAQYCFYVPENEGNVWGHGALISYGVTDWLELGAIGSLLSIDGDPIGGGPMARVRLLKHDGWIPQFSVGGYAVFGDDPVTNYSMFAALYNRLPIGDESGCVKSLGVHAGVRQTWLSNSDRFYVYGGLEVELPWRLYLVGEVSTTDTDGGKVPYAYGLQWRARGINISLGEIQTNGFSRVGTFFGIGYGWQF